MKFDSLKALTASAEPYKFKFSTYKDNLNPFAKTNLSSQIRRIALADGTGLYSQLYFDCVDMIKFILKDPVCAVHMSIPCDDFNEYQWIFEDAYKIKDDLIKKIPNFEYKIETPRKVEYINFDGIIDLLAYLPPTLLKKLEYVWRINYLYEREFINRIDIHKYVNSYRK